MKRERNDFEDNRSMVEIVLENKRRYSTWTPPPNDLMTFTTQSNKRHLQGPSLTFLRNDETNKLFPIPTWNLMRLPPRLISALPTSAPTLLQSIVLPYLFHARHGIVRVKGNIPKDENVRVLGAVAASVVLFEDHAWCPDDGEEEQQQSLLGSIVMYIGKKGSAEFTQYTQQFACSCLGVPPEFMQRYLE
eukprot:PhF_6_TR37689/c0_g1_i1/m.56095